MRNPHAINRQTGRPRWLTDRRFRRLGTIPDQRIADEAGVSLSTVARWRRKLKVPGYCFGRRGLF